MSSETGSVIPDIGAIIWVAVNPIIQLALVGAAGNFLARAGILTPQGSKTMSKVYVQALTPSLMFARMLDSMTPQAAKRLLILVSFIIFYMILGLFFGYVCRRLFSRRLPKAFDYTLLMAGSMSNWGDIPLAVVENITASPPFNKSDGALGVAYVSIFLVMLNVAFFPLGGHKLIARDFKVTNSEVTFHEMELREGLELNGSIKEVNQIKISKDLESDVNMSSFQRYRASVIEFLISLLTPVNISIIAGLVLGLTPAKKLFIKGEDNPYLVKGLNPPLYIVYVTARFLGAACVPVGLLNLGSSLVGLDMHSLPLSLGFTLAFLKLIMVPFIGIPLVYWFTHGLEWIGKEERGLQLVLMFASCVPTATTTLVLTQYYNPTGEAKHLTSLLVIQYAIGLITMTITLGVISYLLS